MFAKIKVYLILGIVLAAVGGGLYWKYQQMQKDILTLTQNNAILDTAVKNSEAAVNQLQADNARMVKELNTLNEKFAKARKNVDDLRNRLSRHDIGASMVGRPSLTEKALNNASKNAMRCVEILSGSPLTEEELSATKPSEINNECWRDANPNFDPNIQSETWKRKNL
tara:strand:- start:189 stop:692 length:504 start_codon:yes stop_codon:yes gene_type:complete